MSKPTVHDYDSSNGWNGDGTEQCPHCEMMFGMESGHHGAVYDSGGTRYEHFTDTDPADGPFYCRECFEELEANRRSNENQSITEFVQ